MGALRSKWEISQVRLTPMSYKKIKLGTAHILNFYLQNEFISAQGPNHHHHHHHHYY